MAARSKKGLIPVEPLAEFEDVGGEIAYTSYGGVRINTMGRPRIRPRVSDPGVLERICEKLIMGHGLFGILKHISFPSAKDVYKELAANPQGDFARGIAYARELAHTAIMDHCMDLAEQITEDNYNSVKAKLDWYKWHQARLHPTMYGDKVMHDITTRNARPVELTKDEFTDIAYRIVDEV